MEVKMKNNNRKIYLTVLIVWGILACLSTIAYTFTAGADALYTSSPFWSIAYWSVFSMFVLAIVGALFFAIASIVKGLADAPKKQLPILGSIAALIIILVICWGVSSGEDVSKITFDKVGADYGLSKIIGGALYMVYVLLAVVLLSLIGSEIFKRR